MNVDWKVEKADRAMLPASDVPTWWPTLQFVSCAEKDSLCGTVMMAWIWHVWINAMVFGFPGHKLLPRLTPTNCCIVYSLNLTTEIPVYNFSVFAPDRCRFATQDSHRSISLCNMRLSCSWQPKILQGSNKGRMKEVDRTEAIVLMYAWRKLYANMRHFVSFRANMWPRLQFVSCAEKDRLSGTVMMAWIWHVWINAMVLVPWHKLLPTDAKELL